MFIPRSGARRLAVAALAALAACGGADRQEPQFADSPSVPLPGPPGAAPLDAPGGEPEELPGVDTTELVRRERHTWWQLVSELYAPCADQAVSIAQCVRESRPCAACVPAAQLLADKIRGGASGAQAQAAYGVRFGPNVKKIDLADSPSRGPEGAPVQIVVWSDFECPSCGRAVPILDEMVERHAPNVRLIHKVYPLRSHAHAEPAARAAIAAHAQGRYWQMERLLFENQRRLEEKDLLGYAQRIGLDMARFRADMAGEAAAKVIARDKAEAERAGLAGTPFIVINGREFDLGLFSLQGELDRWIKTELAILGASRGAAADRTTEGGSEQARSASPSAAAASTGGRNSSGR
ncbi:DsbA family protein [Sorangium sp. So ce1024]|uniref:DsbA family protein n=1 Tax=Sorangium sp. So ce1024 TaxID=3133327 RepID=UPI003F0608C4